jgi:hypothetical protein
MMNVGVGLIHIQKKRFGKVKMYPKKILEEVFETVTF